MELHRWIALSIYSSQFRVCPPLRSDALAPVNLYDEASKVVSSVQVDYVISLCAGSQFVSVPVIIGASPDDVKIACNACKYLNISLHQSQIVSSPGFVVLNQEADGLSVISHNADGERKPVKLDSVSADQSILRRGTEKDDGRIV